MVFDVPTLFVEVAGRPDTFVFDGHPHNSRGTANTSIQPRFGDRLSRMHRSNDRALPEELFVMDRLVEYVDLIHRDIRDRLCFSRGPANFQYARCIIVAKPEGERRFMG